jgi:CheY-like chemotaxis protein
MKALVVDDSPYSIDAMKGYLENSQVEVLGALRDKNKVVEVYEEEVRKGKLIQVIIVNGHNSLSDAQSVCERIRQFENSRNMEPCVILLIAENYVDSKIKEILDPAGNAKVNHFLRAPINFSELQKLLVTIQANMVVEPSEPFRPKKVLIVDDNTFNLQLLGRILEMNHCEYLQAENGEKAVEIYMQNWKDIVIVFMDCEMPVMNGYDATRNIRKFQQTKKIPKIKILGVTGHVSSDDICKDAGMNGTVTKPFPADDIKQIIIESLREYQES